MDYGGQKNARSLQISNLSNSLCQTLISWVLEIVKPFGTLFLHLENGRGEGVGNFISFISTW
jgi:hypothetical protein